MKDYIVRATAANSQIRAFAATTREMVEFARAAHNTSPVATAALGRLLTAGSMMGIMMKGEKDLLTLQVKAGGPLNGMTVTADSKGNVKGYVGNPGDAGVHTSSQISTATQSCGISSHSNRTLLPKGTILSPSFISLSISLPEVKYLAS